MELVNFITSFFLSKKVTMLTAFICWNPELTVKLWNTTMAGGIKMRVYDSLPTPELPAYDIHREGVLIDVECSLTPAVLTQASKSRAFVYRYSWLLLHNSDFNVSTINSVCNNLDILPDSDVTWSSDDAAVEIYRIKSNLPLVLTSLQLDRNYSLKEMEMVSNNMHSAVTRRKNLNNLFMKSATIITQPQYFRGWNDFTNRQIDTYPKLTYPLLMLLAEDLNFRHNMKQVDLYGEEHNGSFDGLAGMLQREQIEVGITSMFMRTDRMRVLHFCSETVRLGGAFMFRQPSQSSVSNVFLLPFSWGVWCAGAVIVVGVTLILAALAYRLAPAHPTLKQLSVQESATFALGTICQQGFHLTPDVVSIRVVMFSTLVCSVFTFTAYSAKIVAILQTPSDAFQTIDDLTKSPMTLGVQETTYKRVYFAESTEPATQRLYKRKLLPLGERAYLSVVEGIARMRTGLFAFQVEESSGYDIISKTFTEQEKCGLKEIQAFRLPMVAVPIRRHSGYRELFAVRLRWQRECGLMSATSRRWLAARPRCETAGSGFRSVRVNDVMPALQILAIGMSIAVLLLGAEILVHRLQK